MNQEKIDVLKKLLNEKQDELEYVEWEIRKWEDDSAKLRREYESLITELDTFINTYNSI